MRDDIPNPEPERFIGGFGVDFGGKRMRAEPAPLPTPEKLNPACL
jgi:hypothetical protein